MYKLCIEDDDGQQTLVSIIRDEITIGRQEGNTIRLTERNVSRQHARLIREGDDIFMEEISARYGVRKNNSKISERAAFREGDVFLIGDYRLTLQGESITAVPAPEQRAPATPPKKPRNEGTAVMPAKPAKLVVISSNFAGQEFPLRKKEMIIGRGEECDIIIDHRSVSQTHAKIVRESNTTYQIVDLNSKNGVCITGDKYTNVHLKRGDVVELGHVKFRFVEPGENYVFTPQHDYDEEESTELMHSPFALPQDEPKKSNTGLAIGIGVVLLALVVIGGAFATGMFDGPTKPTQPTVIATTKKTEPAKPTAKTNKAAFEEAKSENPKVLAGIKKAKNAYEEGDIKRAIATLEALNEYADPSPEDKENIDKLLSKARMERAFEKDYVAAQALMESKDYLEALRIMKRVPPISIFDTLLEEDRNMALSEVMDQAKSAYSERELDKARELASALVELDDQNDEARALLERINKRPTAVAVKSAKPRPDRTEPSKPKPKPKTVKPNPKPAKLTKAEMAQMFKEANDNLFEGSVNVAISNCKTILRSGGTRDCHRIMGIAYNRAGNKSAACKSLKKALRTNPPNKAAVQNFMDNIACDI